MEASTPTSPDALDVDIPWLLLSVGADGRSLLIRYYFGGCVSGKPTVSLNESRTDIRVAIALRDHSHDRHVTGCPDVARAANVIVKMAAPVAGRRVRGQGTLLDGKHHGAAYRTTQQDGTLVWLVPRLVGLASIDAERVLLAQGFEPRLTGNQGYVVIAQHPGPDHVAPSRHGAFHGTVTLHVGGPSRLRQHGG